MDNEYFASINEVSKRLSVPAHTLRYWEKQFPVAIRPTTGAGGRRYYRAETVDRLIVIRDLLYKQGLTIAGVKKLLREGNLPKTADEFTQEISVSSESVKPQSKQDSDKLDVVISLLEGAKNLLKTV
ncbi:MAG TPA: MerR family transcriptional regulator [Candidatus Enterousia avicola]|uniref:MerR family transcriptional regulator n=1 Tax=Candidatus Enterousia avicola TaxID=2840787 RepID=A0A9D1MRD1_9PROT|nr:MerR family transcriptional regulator [Candidatus Enterousia avicola]